MVKRYKVEFADYDGSGASLSCIEQAERSLGVNFPPSYRWWLQRYGGGQIRSDIIYGLDDEEIGKPDILELDKQNKADGLPCLLSSRLMFAISNDEEFYLDLSTVNSENESPVYIHAYEEGEFRKYSDSFLGYIEKRILEICVY
nr:SMI1/KNR4 family protein [Pseudoteredinibacter isoporae]